MNGILSIFFGLFILTNINAQKPKVVSSASMIMDMTKNIAGDLVEHGLIVPIGGDPHIYDPTPRDAQLVSSADQIFINGLTFEGWVLELIANSGTKAFIDTVTNGITPIGSEIYKGSYDPHAWMDLSNALVYIKNIKNALINLDPKNEHAYTKNHDVYRAKLIDLDNYIMNRIQEIPAGKRMLITSHDAFKYYGKRYGLQLEAIVGISTEAQAQTSDIIRITKAIKESNVPAIFVESTINPKLIEQIASDNNVLIGGKLYADSIGLENSEAPSYYDMLKHNTDVIVNALSQEKISVLKPKKSSNSLLTYLIIGFVFLFGMLLSVVKLNR